MVATSDGVDTSTVYRLHCRYRARAHAGLCGVPPCRRTDGRPPHPESATRCTTVRRLPSGRNAASAARKGLDERMNAVAVAALTVRSRIRSLCALGYRDKK